MKLLALLLLIGVAGLCPKQAATVAVEAQARAAVQDDCSDCQAFITDVQQRFSDPNQQQQVLDLIVNKACPMLASVFPQCATYAQEYVPIGFQLFESMTSSSICQGIMWCSSSAHRSGMFFRKLGKLMLEKLGEKSAVESPANDECADCEAFITDAQRRYTDPAEQQKIIDLVANQACPMISNVFPQCAAYAKEYIPLGFQYLMGYTPQQVCQISGFCSSAAQSVPIMTLTAARKVGDSCSDCEQFMSDAQKFYSDPQNQQQVVDLVTGSLCPIISSVFPECVQFAKTEIPMFFVTFEQTDTATLCTYIGLCSSFVPVRSPMKLVHRFEMPQRPSARDDQYCTDCQTFFTDVQQYYTDPNNQQRVIDELVDQVCPQLQQQFPECAQLLPEYLPLAFQALLSASPSFLCTQLRFCSSSSSFASLLTEFATRGLFRNALSSVALPENKVKQLADVCTDCGVVVAALRIVVQSNSTVQYVIDKISMVCDVVAQAGRPMCFGMVRAALNEFVITFKASTDDQVCATFAPQCAKTPTLRVARAN